MNVLTCSFDPIQENKLILGVRTDADRARISGVRRIAELSRKLASATVGFVAGEKNDIQSFRLQELLQLNSNLSRTTAR